MTWLFSAGLALFIFAGILYFSAVIPATRKHSIHLLKGKQDEQ